MGRCRPNASGSAFSPTAAWVDQRHGSIAGDVLLRRQPRHAGKCMARRRSGRVRARPAPPLRPLRSPGAPLPGAAHDRRAGAAATRPG
ncbi:hypothetical protein Xcom_03680 [Xanthomonas axonopodis pv. commiphoreae]|nr:hypothetical protein Xcom_03680 [Xanthomonas axonopodis pv. commiphoreae]